MTANQLNWTNIYVVEKYMIKKDKKFSCSMLADGRNIHSGMDDREAI
jgi:hypothetical protein